MNTVGDWRSHLFKRRTSSVRPSDCNFDAPCRRRLRQDAIGASEQPSGPKSMIETVQCCSPPAPTISPAYSNDRRRPGAAERPPRQLLLTAGDTATRRTTTSRAPAWRRTGAPAITTPFARCAIRERLSVPRITKESSPSTSPTTAANRKGL
jgi:hypothetical protein